mmetsp:Transcript_80858/g.232320  ORF Transcript_80858/g.232320 Transcript_80858/m.232320 type:complete len:354 (-) Transcript_80858:229-1290(-)
MPIPCRCCASSSCSNSASKDPVPKNMACAPGRRNSNGHSRRLLLILQEPAMVLFDAAKQLLDEPHRSLKGHRRARTHTDDQGAHVVLPAARTFADDPDLGTLGLVEDILHVPPLGPDETGDDPEIGLVLDTDLDLSEKLQAPALALAFATIAWTGLGRGPRGYRIGGPYHRGRHGHSTARAATCGSAAGAGTLALSLTQRRTGLSLGRNTAPGLRGARGCRPGGCPRRRSSGAEAVLARGNGLPAAITAHAVTRHRGDLRNRIHTRRTRRCLRGTALRCPPGTLRLLLLLLLLLQLLLRPLMLQLMLLRMLRLTLMLQVLMLLLWLRTRRRLWLARGHHGMAHLLNGVLPRTA